MSKQITAFKCDWCSRCFGRKCNANRHEQTCNNNPARRNCKTCIHGIWACVGQRPDPCDYDSPMEILGPYCDFHDKPIHERPYYIDCDERTNYGFEYPQPVPGTCLHYEYKGKAEWTPEESA